MTARESDAKPHDQHFGWMTAGVSLGQLVGPLLVGARGSLRAIVGTRGVPAGIVVSIAVLSAADLFTAFMPVLGEEGGIEPRIVGLLLALRAGASIASRVAIGPLVSLLGRRRLITTSALLGAGALVAVTLTRDPLVLAVLAAVVGVALGFGQPASMTIVVQLVPAHARATALAVRLTGNRLGQVAVPAGAGLVAGSAGTASVFWLLAAILVASGVVIHRASPEQAMGARSTGAPDVGGGRSRDRVAAPANRLPNRSAAPGESAPTQPSRGERETDYGSQT